MNTALIGYTGFVGQNLLKQSKFDDLYNSKNITEIRNKTYNLAVCSAIPASMWLANNHPEKDFNNILSLLNNLKQSDINKIILISSIAVFKQPVTGFDEESSDFEDVLAYGKNRRFAEQFILENFKDCHILRLPALFGSGLKKNFIYDIQNQEPAFMPENIFDSCMEKLSNNDANFIKSYYSYDENKKIYSFEKEKANIDNNRQKITAILASIKVSSLNFTNPKSKFQFYNIDYLHKDIQTAINHDIKILNISSEPISAEELMKNIFGITFENNNKSKPFDYNMKSKFYKLWNNETKGYLYSKNEIFNDLKKYFKSGCI